jgi:hypothetical protein
MDLDESAKLSTRIFLESSENLQQLQNKEKLNNNADMTIGILPAPKVYQRGTLLDSKADETRNYYRSYFNRSIGQDARL